jgi:hypothetical protein
MIDQLAGDKIGDRERRRFHRSMPDSRLLAADYIYIHDKFYLR